MVLDSNERDNFTFDIQPIDLFLELLEDISSCDIFLSTFTSNENLKMTISSSAQKIVVVPNLGGSSEISEALSFEFLNKTVQAKLLKTEREVIYFQEREPKTDYVCEISEQIFGVSVTRAMAYRGEFTKEEALRLLTKKLEGIKKSTKNSKEKWSKQILHIWTRNKETTNVVATVYNEIPDNVRSNTVVIVTTSYNSSCIFTNEIDHILIPL